MSCTYSGLSNHDRERIRAIGYIFGNFNYYDLGNCSQFYLNYIKKKAIYKIFLYPLYNFLLKYPTTVATLSRRARDRIEEAYKKSVDDSGYFSLDRCILYYNYSRKTYFNLK